MENIIYDEETINESLNDIELKEETLIFESEEEFNEYIKRFQLSQDINFREFEEIFNLAAGYYLGDVRAKFAIHTEDLSEEDIKILKDKLDKLTKQDNAILWYLSLSLLKNNAKCIKEQLERVE